MNSYSDQEVRLSNILSWVALGAMVLSILFLFGAYFGAAGPFFTQPPFAASTVGGLSLLAFLGWFAAGDVRRFRTMIFMLIGGLVLGAVTLIVFFILLPGSDQRAILLVGAAILLVAAGFIGWALSQAKAGDAVWTPWPTEKPITSTETIGRIIFVILGILWIASAAACVYLAISGASGYFREPMMIAGTVVDLALLGVGALVSARSIRTAGPIITILILTHGVSFLAAGAGLLGVNRAGADVTNQQLMTALLLIDLVITVGLFILQNAMDRSVLDYLGFFDANQFRALEAIAETLIEGGASRKVPPHQIALRTDRYLSSFPSSRLWLAKLAVMGINITPLIVGQPPLSAQNPAARREFVDRYFKRDIVADRGIYWLLDRPIFSRLIDFIEGGVRFNIQLTYMGYYSDPVVHQEIGYVPFSERSKQFPKEAQKGLKPVRKYPPLRVATPADFRRDGIDSISSADVVIIGSGAAGSTIAEQLAEKGRDVLLVEKGAYTPPDDFTEDEIDMISHLYADGAIQISQALRFTVLQGNTVGGSTVINNAVCFTTPDEVLTHWNDPSGLNAGIEVKPYREAQEAVRTRMKIQSILDSTTTRKPADIVLNPGDNVIGKGIASYLSQGSYEYEVVNANILDCLGCGYCNIGCQYGRKLSMLDEVLPAAQQAHPDKFRIISEAQAVKLNTQGSTVTGIVLQFRDGRQLTIHNPKTVVVSAGTVASSWLLMQSGIGKGELPVGKHLCFNMGSPLHGYWDQKLDSYAGLQIAHYLKLAEKTGFVFETWYNPPVAQSLTMPGWLDTHFDNMLHYDHMAAVGILVGSETNAYLTPALILRGSPDIVYEPTQGDLDKLLDALTTMGHIMFAGGAKEVYANSRRYGSYKDGLAAFKSPDDLSKLRSLVKDSRDIFLGTGHPQGGNAISKNRGKDGQNGGVIGPDFKVYGYDNLYVCDASVHPSATTVNPQMTVMTMARYASGLIS